MLKKFISILFAFVIMFQSVTFNVYADGLFTIYGDGVYYTLDNDGVLTVYSETGYFNDGSGVFEKYKADITKIVLSDTITYIASQAFDGCSCEVDLYLPATLKTIDGYAFARCSGFTLKLDENNPYFKLVDGVLYSADMTQLIYASPTLTGNFTVPSSVKTVCDGAFVFSRFENITIPDTVTKMTSTAYRNDPEWGECGRVFAYALTKNISIGKNVAVLERCCVYRCPNLEKLIIRGTQTEFEPDEERPYVIDDNEKSTVFVPHNSKAEEYMKKYYDGKWDYIKDVSVGNVTAKPGDTVKIPVKLEQEILFSDISIEIGYDSSALELAGVEENNGIGASFTKAQNLSTNPYNMNWASASNITYGGSLAMLIFNVKTDKAGIYPITVDYYKGRNGNYTDGKNVNYDEQFNALNLIYTPGSVTVETENK